MTEQNLQNLTSSQTLIHQQLHLVLPERIAPNVLCAGEVHNANLNIQFGAHHLQPHRIWYNQKQAN